MSLWSLGAQGGRGVTLGYLSIWESSLEEVS